MAKTLGVTICRKNSTGIPRKNLYPCAGRPLCTWAFDVAAELWGKGHVSKYVVCSDDPEVLRLARHAGLWTLTEPRQLAEGDVGSDEVLRWVVHQMGPIDTYTYIVELMATNPLYTYKDAAACLIALKEFQADSVIAVTALDGHHPARAKRIVNGALVDWCEHCREGSTQRQGLQPPAYIRASAIYAMRREALFSVGRFGHEHSLAYVLPPERGVGIDTMADLKAAEWYLRERVRRERQRVHPQTVRGLRCRQD